MYIHTYNMYICVCIIKFLKQEALGLWNIVHIFSYNFGVRFKAVSECEENVRETSYDGGEISICVF